MFGLGMGEMVIIMIILVLLFGPKKLPELGKGIGQAIREFKNAGKENHPEAHKIHDTEEG